MPLNWSTVLTASTPRSRDCRSSRKAALLSARYCDHAGCLIATLFCCTLTLSLIPPACVGSEHLYRLR